MKQALLVSNYCVQLPLLLPIPEQHVGRSEAEFFSKISIVVEEADETLFWLEILNEAEIVPSEKLQSLLAAYKVVKIVNTIRHNRKKK